MDVNSTITIFSGHDESRTTDPEDTYDSYKYVFIPILLIQIITTIISNAFLLIMISRSFRSCTSLNIFLLSIGIFNLLTSVNQISLVIFNFQPLTINLPRLLCYMMTIIKTTTAIGTVLLHLFISYHRFKTAIEPLQWTKRRKQAWVLGIVTWAIACAVAVFDCILHFNNGDRRTLQSCLWPGVSQCTNIIRLYSQLLILACLSVVSVITCHFYRKTARLIKELELEKLYEQRRNSTQDQDSKSTSDDNHKLTRGERTVVSLFTIFTIHCITQLPTYLYGITISSMASSKPVNESAEANDAIPAVGSVPILLLLATISFLTTGSPLILACINRQFKQHIKSVLRYVSGRSEDPANRQIQAKFPTELIPPPSPVPPPTLAPRNIEIFYGPSKHSNDVKSNTASARYIKSSNSLEIPGAAGSSRPDRVSESSLNSIRSTRPSRISTTRLSVGIAAVNAGIVLSAPGHRTLLNNFFGPDPDEIVPAENLEALYF